MQQRKERRKSRKICLQVLFANDVAGVNPEDVISGNVVLPHIDNIDQYSEDLIVGTVKNMDYIDKHLIDVSENWALDRMSSTDRCLLRQTVYEMLYVDDVPISVSINEAVELAKLYGGEDDSHKFVNGVLGKIARDIEEK